jgi:hypothetical protein
MSSINVLKNSSPVPQELVLKGNFGRNFKIMTMQGVAFSGSGVYESTNQRSGALSINKAEFSTGIKTGYGAIKLLQRILKRSNELTEYGESLQLFFYNLAFGESYLVTIPPSGVTFSQTQDQNMIWQYSINLTILAPLSEVLFQNQMNSKSMNLVGRNAVQSSLNVVAKNVTRMIMGK